MSLAPKECAGSSVLPPRCLAYLLILGLYLTFRGYHAFDGDQAYRLPLLLHLQDPAIYAGDPFVRAFDAFNPHRGALLILSGLVRMSGLSTGLLIAFMATFLATSKGIDRLTCSVSPRPSAGLVAVILILGAKAGNIGTNHLFEAMVLDRLMAMAFAWNAIAATVGQAERIGPRPAVLLGIAAIIHPSFGLQLGLVMSGAWAIWAVLRGRTGVSSGMAVRAIVATGLCLVPGLVYNLGRGGSLMAGLPTEDFRVLAAELQSPQHMVPHLWRMPQWLAFAGYLVLAALALWSRTQENPEGESHRDHAAARLRLAILLGVVIGWLTVAWVAVEVVHDLRATVFQPFRMATLARGLALVLVAGRLVALWERGGVYPRLRAALIAVSLAGDWMFVVVTVSELAASLAGRISRRIGEFLFAGLLAYGLFFLSRHDTESGHWPLLGVLGVALVLRVGTQRSGSIVDLAHLGVRRDTMRIVSHGVVLSLAWAVPLMALAAGLVPAGHPAARSAVVRGLVARCRFFEVPVDDVERLAAWCRENTPGSARFIGPPGPKTFRLWSRRSLAFNRAGSPYHAAGLADWFARFQDHVGVHEPPTAFVRDYLAGRHRLEARYDQLDGEGLAALALRQGADHVIARSDLRAPGPLRRLHSEGRFAAYSVIWPQLSHRQR
jgi:hypothetical protein